IGDGGGRYVIVTQNVVVDSGQYGIGVAGGSDIQLIGNLVLGRQQPFTNVGMYVWNQSQSSCENITVRENRVRWLDSKGAPNAFWTSGNCGVLAGLESNDFRSGDATSDDVKNFCDQTMIDRLDAK